VDSIRIYTGFDQREAVGWHVFTQSLIERTDQQVEIIPLTERLGRRLGIGTDGTNAFTKLRFAIPYLCGYRGWALFVDAADMLMLTDIAELWALRKSSYDVMVCKHSYSTKFPVKYLDQPNLDYEKKNWSSVMLINAGNFPWRKITPEYIAKATGQHLHRFEFLKEERIGEIPLDYNWLIGEYDHNPEAKIAHFSIGVPAWRRYADWDYSTEWFEAKKSANHIEHWEDSFDDTPAVSER
jgi:lipopolysaccharide biosynthesis glycosyltransferase